jgi:hypothetical protein
VEVSRLSPVGVHHRAIYPAAYPNPRRSVNGPHTARRPARVRVPKPSGRKAADRKPENWRRGN